MSRRTLSLFRLDRPALRAFGEELRAALVANDRAALASLLELAPALAEWLERRERVVDFFLVPESDPGSAPFYGSLRRIAKKRALRKMFTSEHPSLEGRLRGYEPLSEDEEIAADIAKLLDPKRLPWYLRRPGATGGWIDDPTRARLARALDALGPVLTPELASFAAALGALDGDAVTHDAL
jgi:hypothetical protein